MEPGDESGVRAPFSWVDYILGRRAPESIVCGEEQEGGESPGRDGANGRTSDENKRVRIRLLRDTAVEETRQGTDGRRPDP